MNCICCKSDRINLKYDTSFFNTAVYRCDSCGLHFSKIDNKNVIEKYYNSSYWINFKKSKTIKSKIISLFSEIYPYFRFVTQRANSQLKYLNATFESVVELGSGRGEAIFQMRKKGWDVTSIEADVKNANYIKSKYKKVNVINGHFENFFITNSFDLVFLSHSLEHSADINNVISNSFRALKPGGKLFIEVPNAENIMALNHSIFNNPHTVHFTRLSIVELLLKHNFDLEDISAFKYCLNDTIFQQSYRTLKFLFLNKDIYIKSKCSKADVLRVIAIKPR